MRLLVILLLCAWIFTPYRVSAQSSDPGTSFWFGFMSNESLAPEDVLVVTISASLATSGVIEIPGQGWSQSFYIQAQSSIDVEIPGDLAEVNSEQTIEGRAIHIQSASPVSVQAVSHATAKTDATRILSDDLLGTHYLGAGYPGLFDFSSQLLIVSTQDGTEIEIVPSVTTSNGNPAGIPFTIQLNQGECYRMIASGAGDFTGTQITATATSGNCRPFAVFGGCVNARVPQTCLTAVDYLFEQLYDVSRWGANYLVVPFGFDINSSYSNLVAPTYTYRILASENSTAVSIDGAASTVIQAGDFIEFNAQEDAHCISSNKPIAVLQYMEGISCAGNGDPAMLWVQPLDATIEEAFFSASDFPDLNTHFINVVIPAAALGTCKLDGVLIPVAQFSQGGACGDYWYCTREVNPGQHRLECPMGFSGSLYSVNDEIDNPAGIALTLANGVTQSITIFEQTICSNSPAQLSVPNNYTSPQWYYAGGDNTLLSSTNPLAIAAPIQNAVYELHAVNEFSGCVDTFYYSVESPEAIPVSIVRDQLDVCSFETVVLTAQTTEPNAIYQYTWLPNEEFVNNNPAQIAVTAEEGVVYSVTLTTPSGCGQGTASITLDVAQGDIARFEVVEDYHRICAGETVSLEVEVEEIVWRDNFDPAISWGDWESISGGDESNLCGVVSGNALYFNGAFPREAITQPLDLSGGATAVFAIKIANGIAPCDDAEPGDHVVLSYSVGGGAWTTIQTFYESAYPDFTVVTVSLPPAACNPNTRLRWRQNGSYTNNQDNWVLDNAYISHSATSSVSCSWSPSTGLSNTLGSVVDATPSFTTMYEVSATDLNTGCDYVDSVWVEVGQPFNLSTPGTLVVCSPQEIMLSVTPSVPGVYEYAWTPNANMQGSFTANPTVDISESQTFVVEAISEFGCTAEGVLEVAMGSLFDIAITVSEDSLCEGESATLTAALSAQVAGVDFFWTGNADIANPAADMIEVSPLTDAQFTCVATQTSSGCTASQTVTIDVTPQFAIDINPNSIQTCTATGTAIFANSTLAEPMQWEWSPQEWVLDATDPSTELTTENSGIITVTATSAAGCIASDELTIDVQPLITDLGEDVGLCIDDTYTISVDWPANYTIVWSTGETSSSITVSNPDTYSVWVQAPDGCISTDEIVVEFFDYPELELGEDTSACVGEEIRLQAGQPGLEYLWNTGQLSREIYVTESGVYSVEITNGYCLSRDTVELVFHPLPVQPFDPEYEYCFEASTESFYLDAKNQGASYVWSNDSTSRIVLIQQPGTYSVVISSEFGCVNEFETTVNRECIEALYIPNSFTPDGDGINDVWFVYGTNIVNYHLQLFTSWGELFYESFDLSKPWTGSRGDGEYYVDSQVYPYIIRYQLVQDNGLLSTERSITGFVTLLR